jgi:hypothetical protein
VSGARAQALMLRALDGSRAGPRLPWMLMEHVSLMLAARTSGITLVLADFWVRWVSRCLRMFWAARSRRPVGTLCGAAFLLPVSLVLALATNGSICTW